MPFPRIAVFEEKDFPTYGVSAQLVTRNIVNDLKAAGFEIEVLGSAALADADQFNAAHFAALVLPQGNTFPKVAFANLRKFHKERGSLITTGIPFTHPVISRDGAFVDTGHEDAPARFGESGIGVGGFAGPGKTTAPATISPGDPLRLKGVVTETPLPRPAPQWLDPKSLPKGVRLIPALGDAARPLVALVVHESGPFAGAVGAWTYRLGQRDRELYESQQLVTRATVAALAQSEKLSKAEAALAFKKLDALPRPKVYANITLPKVPRTYNTSQRHAIVFLQPHAIAVPPEPAHHGPERKRGEIGSQLFQLRRHVRARKVRRLRSRDPEHRCLRCDEMVQPTLVEARRIEATGEIRVLPSDKLGANVA